MEAKRIIFISDNQLCWTLSAFTELLRSPMDSYFNNLTSQTEDVFLVVIIGRSLGVISIYRFAHEKGNKVGYHFVI